MDSTTTKTNNQWKHMTIISTNKTEVFIPLEELLALVAKYVAEQQKMDCSITDYIPHYLEQEKKRGLIFSCTLTERSGE